MLKLYKLFCLINHPLWWLVLYIRSYRGKEHRLRYKEKIGYGYKERPTGEVIWVHALGLGETLALTFFLKKLSASFKNKTILFTSSTLNSYLAFSRIKMNKNIIHQFAPIDNYLSLRRFFSHWKPSMALISEIDLWPLRVLEAKKLGIPLILFNSRMNERKKNSRNLIYKSFKEILGCFDYIYLQDEDSRKYFQYFGVSDSTIRICGPFKMAGTNVYENRLLKNKVDKLFKNKFVWIAGSIHKDEEIEILEAFKLAKKKLPNLILIIVPRLPESSNVTAKKSFSYSRNTIIRKSGIEFPKNNTDIFIVATVGELTLWYRVADIAFIGNSLNYKSIKTGKNPFEAVQAGCLVIHGPKMLEPGYSKLFEEGISEIVSDRSEICQALIKYSSLKNRKIKLKKGKNFIYGNRALVENFVSSLKEIYNKKGRKNIFLP